MAQSRPQQGRTQQRRQPPPQQPPQQPPQGQAVVAYRPRMPMPVEAQRAGIAPDLWQQFVDITWPSAKTPAGVMLAVDYCRRRNLDPLKRPVHVVPIWNSALQREVESVWPGIGELRTTAMRTKDYGGMDDAKLGPMVKASLDTVQLEYPEWAQVTLYRLDRLGRKQAIVGPKVYWRETYATAKRDTLAPNSMWKKRPIGQLVKCAEAAALRAGFPEEIGNTYSAEEMWGQVVEHVPTDATRPPRPDRQRYIEQPAEPTRTESTAAPENQVQEPSEPILDVMDADGVITEYVRSNAADALINALEAASKHEDKDVARRGLQTIVSSKDNQETLTALGEWKEDEVLRVRRAYSTLWADLDPFGLPPTRSESGIANGGGTTTTAAPTRDAAAADQSKGGDSNGQQATAATGGRFPAPPSRERSWTVWAGEMAATIRAAGDRGRLADLNGEIRNWQNRSAPQGVIDDLMAVLDERSREL